MIIEPCACMWKRFAALPISPRIAGSVPPTPLRAHHAQLFVWQVLEFGDCVFSLHSGFWLKSGRQLSARSALSHFRHATMPMPDLEMMQVSAYASTPQDSH